MKNRLDIRGTPSHQLARCFCDVIDRKNNEKLNLWPDWVIAGEQKWQIILTAMESLQNYLRLLR
jgi:hypothetical protein